jgi:hypothetical protein
MTKFHCAIAAPGGFPNRAGAEVTNDHPWHPSTRLLIFTQAERPLLFSSKFLKQDHSRSHVRRFHGVNGLEIAKIALNSMMDQR